MSRFTLHACLAVVLVMLLHVAFVNGDYFNYREENDYVDPGDMLHYDTNTKTMVRDRAPAPKEQTTQEIQLRDDHHDGAEKQHPAPPPSCPKSEFHFYKRFIRIVLAHLTSALDLSNDEEEDPQFDVLMKLTASQLAKLKSYVAPASGVAVQDVDEILTYLIKRVRLHQEATEYVGRLTWLERLLERTQDNAGKISAALAGFLVILIFRQLSPARAFVLGLVLLFVAGSVYEGVNMYQKLEAEKFAERHKLDGIPEHCNPEAMSVFRRIWWSLKVDVFGSEDPCKKYYELLMVDTRFEINPLQVAMAAVGKVFEAMAKFGGSAFGLFYSRAMEHFNFFEKILFLLFVTAVSVVAIMYIGPALVFSLPSLIRGVRAVRRMQTREMVENIPQDQQFERIPGGALAQGAPAAAIAPCSVCGNHQPVRVKHMQPLSSSQPKITITSGNKRISIEDVEPTLPGARVESCMAVGDGSEEKPPESSPSKSEADSGRLNANDKLKNTMAKK